jgi:hypothetical protein
MGRFLDDYRSEYAALGLALAGPPAVADAVVLIPDTVREEPPAPILVPEADEPIAAWEVDDPAPIVIPEADDLAPILFPEADEPATVVADVAPDDEPAALGIAVAARLRDADVEEPGPINLSLGVCVSATADPRARLSDPDPVVRAEAIRELNDPAAADVAGRALDDEAPQVRREAARALGRLNGPRAGRLLTAAVRADPSPEVRGEAVDALAALLTRRRPDEPGGPTP